jgi:hypothetical protein
MSLCVLPGGGLGSLGELISLFFGFFLSLFLLFVFWFLLYFLSFWQAFTRKSLLASFMAPRYEGVLHQFCDSTAIMLVHSGSRSFHPWLPLDSMYSTV